MVFCNLPFYFHSALTIYLDIWARISLFTGVDMMPGNK